MGADLRMEICPCVTLQNTPSVPHTLVDMRFASSVLPWPLKGLLAYEES